MAAKTEVFSYNEFGRLLVCHYGHHDKSKVYFASVNNCFRSEYWKSLPRKFCEICKCWFADNKASIQFHERGKRHQENAAKRIKDIQKKGIKDFKKQQKLEDDMARIERAALAAYKKDLQNNAEVITSTVLPELPEIQQSTSFIEVPVKKPLPIPKNKKNKPKIKQEPLEETDHSEATCDVETPYKFWYEAMTDEGHKYYWNNLDSESQWEPPAEGYVSIEQQQEEQNYDTTLEISIKVEKEDITCGEQDSVTIKTEEKVEIKEEEEQEDPTNLPSNIGPQPKHNPYGQWVTVKKVEPVQIDLQLPMPSEDYTEVVIPVAREEQKLKFKEKIISYIGDNASTDVTFKKRKLNGSSKRNTRQRINDDD